MPLNDNDPSWAKNPHGVRILRPFTKLTEAIEHAISPDVNTKNPDAGNSQKALINDLMVANAPQYYGRPSVSDTSVGGNDAINCLWQFGEDDDIVHPMHSLQPSQAVSGKSTKGLGRVYKETYQDTQQILWLSLGVPKYTDMKTFYLDSVDPKTAQLMNKGEISAGTIIGDLLGSGIRLAFELPFLPIIGMQKLIGLATEVPITKYYSFKPAMPLYYRMVNVIMSHLAVGMGLYAGSLTGTSQADDRFKGLRSAALPEILKDGPDIFTIIDKRARMLAGSSSRRTTDQLLLDMRPSATTDRKYLGSDGSILAHAKGGSDYIGFRIEKGSDATESVSNTTGQSTVASNLNSKSSSAQDKSFGIAEGNTGFAAFDAAINTAKDITKGVAHGLGIGGIVEVVSGNGFFDIPDVWKGSSFSKSHSFTIQLRSKYGDPVSIYQSIYIPLAMLLAAALPRGVGKNAFTAPFILQAYAKGQFAIPLGIIESMTIKRGLSEFGWTHQQLPTAVDVTLNIKDLSPAFFLSMGDAGEGFLDAFKANSSMHEYLATLSGIGLAERTFFADKFKKRLAAATLIKKNTTFSPLYWTIAGGHSGMVRTLTNLLPAWNTPVN